MIEKETFNIICWSWIAIAIIIFPILLRVKQPYGKHTKKGWGPMIDNRLGWIIMELPALLVFMYFALAPGNKLDILSVVAIFLWGLHYVHRSLIFPFQIKTKGKKMSVVIVLSAIAFNTVNGFLNGYWISHFAPERSSNTLVYLSMTAGIILFFSGYFINKYHDHILIKLRRSPGDGYKIPYGGLFKYVSCPNFFGEILTWLGFFVLTLSPAALTFLVWTLVNLIPRALDHHKWYLSTFTDYPSSRKAVIPFLL